MTCFLVALNLKIHKYLSPLLEPRVLLPEPVKITIVSISHALLNKAAYAN